MIRFPKFQFHGWCSAVFIGLILCSLSLPAQSQPPEIKLDMLKEVIVLENGRKMPLDTFAQNTLKQLSGRSKYQKTPAIHWLARVLFTPHETTNDEIFLINHPEVLQSLGITPQKRDRGRYSFGLLKDHTGKLRQLALQASRIEAKDRSLVESELIILYNKTMLYRLLIESFSFAMPHSDFDLSSESLREKLGINKATGITFFDIYKKYPILMRSMSASDRDESQSDRGRGEAASDLLHTLNQWLNSHRDMPLTVIPNIGDQAETWISHWDVLFGNRAHPRPLAPEPFQLADAMRAYRENDQDGFDHALGVFNNWVRAKAAAVVDADKISREIFYNRLDPFYKSMFFYGFSFLLLLLGFLILQKWFDRLSLFLFLAGFVFHTVGIITRMLITGRPPVTNLYETFIFTGWTTALLGIILILYKKRSLGILTGSLSGLVALLIAGKYALEGDTMGMLMAVLDSNFWLATHVITITLGYAGIVLSGIIGHVYVLQRLLVKSRQARKILKNTYQSIYATQAFGLLFTFIGTVTGGIWADQSWGRFWGWDPKENGALLIVLWSAILFHSRLAKWIKELGFALGSVLGIITVALAWFGVNLLGVGLHSYGFTSGIARWLMAFVIFEMLFVLAAGAILNLRKKGIPQEAE